MRLVERAERCDQAEISIHAPHAGCDSDTSAAASSAGKFQSTHPMRGATAKIALRRVTVGISIHAPHAGCDFAGRRRNYGRIISIHAPHAGCDRCVLRDCTYTGKFQSTHPMRGATATNRAFGNGHFNFNPRTPCGVRLEITIERATSV